MKTLIKSLILFPTLEKWKVLNQHRSSLKERDVKFDEILEFIDDFHRHSELLPGLDSFKSELTSSNDLALLGYLLAIIEDLEVRGISDDAEFYSHIKIREKMNFEQDLFDRTRDFNNAMATLENKTLESMGNVTRDLISTLHQVHGKAFREEASCSGLVYGNAAINELKSLYQEIEDKRKSGEYLYYDFGFSRFKDVKIKLGDLVIIGGFTSNGKSIWSRYLAYRMMVKYGMNAMYVSMEMKYSNQLMLFQCIHANNKKIFPGSPKISFNKFKEGRLSDEEKHFLLEVAGPDFVTNEHYGSLYVEQPNKPRYRFSDVKSKVNEIENTIMPIHVLVIDYISMLYPLETDQGNPKMEDYNLLIQEFKNYAMSHRNKIGDLEPIIAVTPAQISRGAYDEALGNNGSYDLSCLRMYSGLEQSADIVVSTLLTPAMIQGQQIRLQDLKNRDGAIVVDPIDLHIDMEHGFCPSEMKTVSDQETIKNLHAVLKL